MKTIFDETTHGELLERLGKLAPDTERRWGKMSASQMMEHAARALEMAAGKKPIQQRFIGKAIGWIFKSGFLGEKPIPRSAPTGRSFIIQGEPDFEATRKRLTDVMAEFYGLGEGGTDGNIHGFFGPLSGKQWGETQYKHLDHHLRQFGL
jgi:hypothetical protein